MSDRDQAIAKYRRKVLESRDLETRLKKMRGELKQFHVDFDKTEDDLKAVQNVGQIIGEVLKRLDDDRFIVKASSGPRYVVGCRNKVNKEVLKAGTRVALDMTTLTIMRILPREVDPMVFGMLNQDPGKISYGDIGGLSEQIRELRETIELPLTNPDLFLRVGIKPPKGVLLYGPPGTGKTLLARALANNIEASFLKVVASAIVDKYIGESARIIREMFGYAKEHQPCVIFMDEIDAIGGRRFSQGTSADREIQRTLMELLNQFTEPILCCPNDPDDAKLLSEVQGQKIDEVFIGSCMTNIGHYRAAGKMLSKQEGQLPTRLWIAPPTKMDQEQLSKEGFYATYGKVGARTEMPGCSLCMGNQARVADNAYVISTSTRNFPNRLGKGAMVFLGSAELSAAVATIGRLPTPEEYLKCYAELGSDEDKKDIYKYLNFDQVESYVEAAADV